MNKKRATPIIEELNQRHCWRAWKLAREIRDIA